MPPVSEPMLILISITPFPPMLPDFPLLQGSTIVSSLPMSSFPFWGMGNFCGSLQSYTALSADCLKRISMYAGSGSYRLKSPLWIKIITTMQTGQTLLSSLSRTIHTSLLFEPISICCGSAVGKNNADYQEPSVDHAPEYIQPVSAYAAGCTAGYFHYRYRADG